MSSSLDIMKQILNVILPLYFCVKTDAFSWSPVQQAKNTISTGIGSTAVLSCDFILSPSENQRASSFYVLSWSREMPRGSGQWATLVLDSPPIFLGKQDLDLNDRFHFGSRSSLRVYGVTHEDDTNYRCDYRSSFPTTPNQVRLNVQYEPMETRLKAKETNIKFGQSLYVNCSSRANPSPYYQIYKNGNLVQNTSKGEFYVQKVDSSHEGEYKCVPVNHLGKGSAKTLKITVEESLLASPKSRESHLDGFPMWAFGAIGGGCLIIIIFMVIIACKCRGGGKNQGIYQPKLSEQGGTVSSLHLEGDSQTTSGPDMYRGQNQEPTGNLHGVAHRTSTRTKPTNSGLKGLKETAINKPSDYTEAYDGPYTSLRTDADQQYEHLKTFEMQRKSVSVDEKDHPESHDGPYSIIEPMVYSENVPSPFVPTRDEEEIEVATEIKQDEPSSPVPPPLYIELSKEEYV